MFANIGKMRKNGRLSGAVKGRPLGPGANLPPALESLLCEVSLPDLCHPQCRALSSSRSWTLQAWVFKLLERIISYWERGVDALELSLGLNVLPFAATHSMNLLPFHREEGHTSEGSAGSSDSSSGQHAKHPSVFGLLLRRDTFRLPHHHGCLMLSSL